MRAPRNFVIVYPLFSVLWPPRDMQIEKQFQLILKQIARIKPNTHTGTHTHLQTSVNIAARTKHLMTIEYPLEKSKLNEVKCVKRDKAAGKYLID